VKSPQDRRALEKELPSLVAARDKAVTASKREQLQKETAQIPGHVANDAQVAQGARLLSLTLFLDAVAHGSAVAWRHLNLLGEYDFTEEKLQDSVGIRLPKISS
jgi:hypothetical protein